MFLILVLIGYNETSKRHSISVVNYVIVISVEQVPGVTKLIQPTSQSNTGKPVLNIFSCFSIQRMQVGCCWYLVDKQIYKYWNKYIQKFNLLANRLFYTRNKLSWVYSDAFQSVPWHFYHSKQARLKDSILLANTFSIDHYISPWWIDLLPHGFMKFV